MDEFIRDFADINWELAKECMVLVENEIVKKIGRHLERRWEKEKGFFNEEEKALITAKIKEAVWKEMITDLNDYGF